MRAFSNYNETQVFTETVKILSGGYIAKIMAAEVKTYNGQNGSFEKLEISFDIDEGDFKDYYAEQYRSNPNADKKWKGKISLYVPTDDGSDKDAITKRRFKTTIDAIEQSNSGYRWDWDEKKLKGKKCGVVLQNKEWEYNGKTGWSAVPYSITSVESIRNNTFYMPKDKPLQYNSGGYTTQSAPANRTDFVEVGAEDESDLPF